MLKPGLTVVKIQQHIEVSCLLISSTLMIYSLLSLPCLLYLCLYSFFKAQGGAIQEMMPFRSKLHPGFAHCYIWHHMDIVIIVMAPAYVAY